MLSLSGLIQNSEIVGYLYFVAAFKYTPNFQTHIHSSLVEQIFLDLWSKPGMIALIKERGKKKAPSLSNCNKAVIPLSDSVNV